MRLDAACTVILLGTAAFALGEPVRWGNASGGLRLGIRTTQTDDRLPALEIVLENQGTQEWAVEFPDVDAGLVHSLHFEAVRNGEVLTVLDTATLKLHPPSLVRSAILLLAPGGRRTFVIPIDRFICVVDRQDTPLQAILSGGYSIRAGLSLRAVTLSTPFLATTEPDATSR